MNETITIDGKDYEVLTFGKYAECETVSHGLLGNGILLECTYAGEATYQVDGYIMSSKTILKWGIQPLKLVERVPVEFVATFALICSYWYPLHTLDDAQGSDNNKKMKFKCTEITEGA